ncbi:MAG TPA: SH3 domain-containing protein [Chloroflexota bacterium]|nr:SH3 domain-containing protein [Chloroflexota bacterium]
MTRILTTGWRLSLVLVVLVLGIAPAASPFTPDVAYAQSDLSADPKAVSPTVNELRTGFQFVPEKSEQREPVPGIIVYEADFVRDQTKANFANGPIEIKSLVAKTANSSQAAEQFASSRQALTTASPAWVESKVSKLGDEATGLTMEGTSAEGPAVAHLFLLRRGAMVVGITVAGLTKPTRMAEAEAIAAVVLRKIDPAYKNQTGARQARQLNTQRPAANVVGSGSTSTAQQGSSGAGSGAKVRVANTGGTGVRLRMEPSLKGQIVGRLADGTVLEVVGEDKTADGYTWKNVRAPGDGRGWVASNYVVAVANSSGSTQTVAASSPPSTSSSASTSNTSSSSSSSSSTGTTARTSSSTTGEQLKVDVSAKQAKLKANQEQVVEISVTRNGSPVSDAQVTVKTSPTGETPAASKTDGSGKTRATWNPKGAPGFIGVGVSALAPDGSAGVGGASFEITGN